MAKASKQYVDWLREGERGWVRGDRRWKWDGKQMFIWWPDEKRWSQVAAQPNEMEQCGWGGSEVFPRPAPRRKVRKVRAWALLDNGKLRGLYCARRDAKAACPLRFGWAIVKLMGEYTPKARKK